MSKRKNILGWLVKSLLVFIFLIVIVMVFTPGWINLDMVKDNIKKKISTDVGGRITYHKLNLKYFPRPHVVIQKAQISKPDNLTVDIEWMRVYPKILPLFKGSLEFAVVRVDYADCAVKLPQIKKAADRQPEPIPSFDDTVKAFAKAVRSFPEVKLPDLNLRIKNGRVNLVDPFGRVFKLREVQAAYIGSKNKIDLSIKCKSNLWKEVSISGSLDPSDFKGAGLIKLSRFRPQNLIAYIFPQSAIRVSETRANVNIAFTSNGDGNIKADVSGAIPILELISKEENLAIKGTVIRGALEVDKEMIRATLTEFKVDDPKLNLTGMLIYDENLQDILLSLEASQIDADSVRQAVFKLAGRSSIIQDIFKVIRGGHVPWMTVQLRGQSFADFGNMDNLVIEGRMTRGKLFIPGAELDLVEVFGDARIAGGVLYGEKLSARFGDSHGQKGTITLGFNNNLEPFHLNIDVKADLSQLPPVLNRIISDRKFVDELARVKNLKGTASGVLTLGDNLANLGARVAVSEAHLTARYNRIPFPIKLDGGHFFYEDSRIVMQEFNAAIGASSFKQISTTFDWSKTPNFKANTRKSNFDIGQLYSWLLSFDTIKKKLKEFSSIKGNIAAQKLIIRGPMFSPRKWNFQTGATINKLVMTSSKLPEDLLVNRGQIAWRGSRIKFAGVDATMGKSSATEISGSANWEKKLMVSVQSGVSKIDPEDLNPLFKSSKYFSKIINQFKPLKGILVFQHINYDGPFSGKPRQQIKFSAEFQQFRLNSKRLPGPLQINNGRISWHNNRLSLNDINARVGKSHFSQLYATFDMIGDALFKLECKSANLLAGEIYPFLVSFEQFLPGIKVLPTTAGMLSLSDVDLNGPVNSPSKWHCAMTAGMQNIAIHSEALEDPLAIIDGSFDLSSENDDKIIRRKIDVKSTNLIWGKNHLILSGQINLSDQGLLLAMKASADSLDWNKIDSLLKNLSDEKVQAEQRKRKINWLGTIYVKSDSFIWHTYTVRPLEAEITFKTQEVVVAVHRADICGISLRGLLNWSDQTLDLYFVPTASNYKLASTLPCLTTKENLATGTYNLNGEILAKAKSEAIIRSLTGSLGFSATQGRIYRFGLLAKLLAILNVTEIYRGEIPDLIGEGFAYRSMSAHAKLQGGKIIMDECTIDGASMGIACEGEIDLVEKEVDLIVLVAPFKTVDRIVEILPLIGNVLGGKLISIPFKAKGDLNDPTVYALPPTAVGSGILGILERTLKLPITIIQPVISGVKDSTARPPVVTEDSPR